MTRALEDIDLFDDGERRRVFEHAASCSQHRGALERVGAWLPGCQRPLDGFLVSTASDGRLTLPLRAHLATCAVCRTERERADRHVPRLEAFLGATVLRLYGASGMTDL